MEGSHWRGNVKCFPILREREREFGQLMSVPSKLRKFMSIPSVDVVVFPCSLIACCGYLK